MEQSDFVIDDLGLTGADGFPLLDMKGKLKKFKPKMASANNESSFSSQLSPFHFFFSLKLSLAPQAADLQCFKGFNLSVTNRGLHVQVTALADGHLVFSRGMATALSKLVSQILCIC